MGILQHVGHSARRNIRSRTHIRLLGQRPPAAGRPTKTQSFVVLWMRGRPTSQIARKFQRGVTSVLHTSRGAPSAEKDVTSEPTDHPKPVMPRATTRL